MNEIKAKQQTYIKVFSNELGKDVLSDLRSFCCATRTTISKTPDGKIDPLELARFEGRREVFLQIMNMINVDFEGYYEYEGEY